MKQIQITSHLEMTDEFYEEEFRDKIEDPSILRIIEKEQVEEEEGLISARIEVLLLS